MKTGYENEKKKLSEGWKLKNCFLDGNYTG
jgi:hypothetical protein